MNAERDLASKIWYLQKINLFGELDQSKIKYLGEKCQMKKYEKKETIFTPTEDDDRIYFLKKGMVRLYKLDPSGKELTFALLGEGECFGSLSPFQDSSSEEFAQALEPTLICFIPRDMFFEVIEDNPELTLKINKLLGLRVIELKVMAEELAFKSVKERTASLLVRLYEKFGKKDEAEKKINLSLSHYDLSTMIGATREATTVALDKLKKEGLIEVERKKIFIKDLEGVKKINQPL